MNKEELLKQPISILGLSGKGEMLFKDIRFKTLGHLILLSKKDLLSFQGIGKKTVIEIEEKLSALGLELSEEGYGMHLL